VAISYRVLKRGKRARAPAIYKRSGHVAAGHVLLPISLLHYIILNTLISIAKDKLKRIVLNANKIKVY
jgi:hypothetical protein